MLISITDSQPTVICLMGPTAVGKTGLAIELVQKYPFAIISVDSGMIYRGMDIGTAKPTKEELAIAPHRLIDILDPSESYSAARFCRDATDEIENIIASGKIPLLVGGTMMYFRSLQFGLSKLPSANPEVRQKLQIELKKNGLESLYKRLQGVDSVAAEKITANDSQRILRALEVYIITGESMSELLAKNAAIKPKYKFNSIAIIPDDRAQLAQVIEHRFDLMLDQGFIAEVDSLYKRGDLNEDMPSMRSVGYRQVWQYLAGKLTRDEMREKAIIATRQLAKRQLTWLRSWPDLITFSPQDRNIVNRVGSYI